MTNPVDLSNLTKLDHVVGHDEAERSSLREAAAEADSYLRSFDWCPRITERYLGLGIPGVLALFLFRLERPIHDTDEWLWVVTGDLPSAYFVVDDARNPMAALAVYCDMMENWADAVEKHTLHEDVFPVQAPATLEYADKLRKRIRFIRERIILA